MRSVLERDLGLVWHPYAPISGGALFEVTAAAGSRLTLRDAAGRERSVIDGMASWWCQLHGYRNPELDRAAHDQIDTFSHVMFGGLTHEPAVSLCERITNITPGDLSRVFLVDSGSISVEVAIKMALQYQLAKGRPGRARMASLRGGYHGDTFGTMSVGDPEGSMHSAFPGLVPPGLALPRPPRGRWDAEADTVTGSEPEIAAWIAEVSELVEAHEGNIAGIVFEPVLQGAGGMHPYPLACVRALREVCDRWDLVLVADEIATGLGRLGHLTASAWAGITPDVMCIGKALTGGYLTLAATIATTRIAEAIDVSPLGAIMHGPTFMANPLACRVACASLDLVTGASSAARSTAVDAHRIGTALERLLAPLRTSPGVRDVRTLGAIGVAQLDRPVDVPALTREAVRRGVWLRPFRDLVYTMPPLVITNDEIDELGAGLVGAVQASLT